jgi:phytoene desaturase
MEMSKNQNVIVIGAGLGGLSAAALLAGRGYSVELFEQNATAGGKMQEVRDQGFRFDTGPSLFTMPFLLEKLFESCGEKLSGYLSYRELEPLCRYFYPDGVVFDNHSDRRRTMEQIRQFAPHDADAYASFLDHAESLYEKTADAFLFNPLYSLSDLKGLRIRDFMGIDAFSTVSDKVDQSFESDYLRQFFKRFTTYNGSSPYRAPATLNVIPHVELNQGGYYVEGGMMRISDAIRSLAEKMGVRFHFSQKVIGIETEGRRVTGIRTEEGAFHPADMIVANSDASETILSLLSGKSVSRRKKRRQKKLEPSCSGFVLMLGADRQWEQLRHHNIFFSGDYRKEFEDIFEHKDLPGDPTIYIANTSHTEPGHAPEGGSNLFILVNAPYLTDTQDWDRKRDRYSSFLIEELERRGLSGLCQSVRVKRVITPDDFHTRYGSNKGSIYGTSSNSRFAAFLRPRNKMRGLDNLYMCGGSTHPGGGIPLVIQSAFNVLELVSTE